MEQQTVTGIRLVSRDEAQITLRRDRPTSRAARLDLRAAGPKRISTLVDMDHSRWSRAIHRRPEHHLHGPSPGKTMSARKGACSKNPAAPSEYESLQGRDGCLESLCQVWACAPCRPFAAKAFKAFVGTRGSTSAPPSPHSEIKVLGPDRGKPIRELAVRTLSCALRTRQSLTFFGHPCNPGRGLRRGSRPIGGLHQLTGTRDEKPSRRSRAYCFAVFAESWRSRSARRTS